jgi:hypothetical protein
MCAGRWLSLLTGLTMVACGRDAPPEAGPPEEPATLAAADVALAPDSAGRTLRPFLPDAMRRATRAETFAHDAHAPIACSVCHEAPRGHGAHAGVACADCHRASAAATVRSLTVEQCQSCHHGPEQEWTCEHCHETRGAVRSTQQLVFEVWGAPRARDLPFEHDAHADIACASCHRATPALAPAEPCASCHQDHMAAAVRCASCHVAPPAGAHDVDAHLGCAGAGCHNAAPDVEARADTRAVCLLCHQEQEAHEPGGVCVTCHRVRPATGNTGT